MATERRLIDANALLKELRQELRECQKDAGEFGGENILWAEGIEFAIDTVKQAKPVDAVEVVRCKDCKHYNQPEKGCDYHGYYCHVHVEKEDFCSYGERKDNG